jgi:hypothetical protein
MFHKIMLGLVAVAAIALTAMPSEVYARGGHGHGGWHGGHGGFRGGGFRGYGFGYYGYSYPYAYGCYRTVRVATPFGWRLQRVWVCG